MNSDTCNNTLSSPDEFPFPFPPYDIQEKFMRNLYSALEESKLAIFESPTGTVSILAVCNDFQTLIATVVVIVFCMHAGKVSKSYLRCIEVAM